MAAALLPTRKDSTEASKLHPHRPFGSGRYHDCRSACPIRQPISFLPGVRLRLRRGGSVPTAGSSVAQAFFLSMRFSAKEGHAEPSAQVDLTLPPCVASTECSCRTRSRALSDSYDVSCGSVKSPYRVFSDRSISFRLCCSTDELTVLGDKVGKIPLPSTASRTRTKI